MSVRGQQRAGTAEDPAPEPEPLPYVLARRIEGGGVGKPARIAVGGRRQHHHGDAGRKLDSTRSGRYPPHSEAERGQFTSSTKVALAVPPPSHMVCNP